MTTLATNTTATAATQSLGQRVRFTVGAFRVCVDCALPEAVEDLQYLYADRMIDDADDSPCEIHVQVTQEQSSIPFRKRYQIRTGDEKLSNHRTAREVLPYLEWGINGSVIRTQHRFLQLHAATVAKDGKGVIIAAKSGSGKSTLAAALLSRGWQYYSDEFALIDPQTQQLHPFPKAICIKQGSFDIVRSLGLPLYTKRHYAKAYKGRVGYISPDEVAKQTGKQTIGTPCEIKAVLFPQYMAASTPTAFEMSRAEATMQLGELSFNRTQHGVNAMTTLANVLEKAKCWRVHSGEIVATCELVESLLKN